MDGFALAIDLEAAKDCLEDAKTGALAAAIITSLVVLYSPTEREGERNREVA
uniref:Uncharacterized protein n=1 Tax=Rhizophora mucronata TaxID=61149 RepID=A0A2P2LIZ9_RHIMU